MSYSEPGARAYPDEIKLYKRRWLLMVVFLCHVVNLSLHWVEFGSISNTITRYYGVSPTWVEWTTIVFMVTYLLGAFPALYMLDKFGIRRSLILVTSGIALGAIIKLFSVSPDRFHILMIGQILVAIFSVFSSGFVGHFMATWFGNEEISRTGALILFGDQGGVALGFLIPSLLVENSSNVEMIERGLLRMNTAFAVWGVITFILVVLLFQERPKIPPSFAQAKQLEEEQDVLKSIRRIFTQKSFILTAVSYSLANAVQSIFSTLLNQVIESNFKERAQDAGKVGFVSTFSGMICSLFLGHILDKKRHFKGNALILTLGGTITLIFFSVALKLGNFALVYVSAGMLGACLLGYYSTGIQMGIELTHPTPEGIVVSSITLTAQIFNVFLVPLHGFMLKRYGDVTSNISLISIMIMSFISAALISGNMKREQIEKSGAATELQEFISK